MRALIRTGLFVLACLVETSFVAAQPSPPQVDERARASDHFRRGRDAYLRRDFQGAARAFDDAYAAAPHHDALWNAAQSWESAGEIARAANRYAAYLRLAPADAADRAQATDSLAALARRLGRLHVFVTAGDDPRVDGEPIAGDVVYVYPGTHVVTIQRGRAPTAREVAVAAQEDKSVSFGAEGPPAPTPEPKPETETAPVAVKVAPPARGLPPWTVLVGGGLTGAGALVTTFFGVRSLDAKSDFDRSPSADLLESGRADQTRTNVGLGVTIGLAAVTLAAALFFVDWRSAPAASRTASLRR